MNTWMGILAADDLLEHVLPQYFTRPHGAPSPQIGWSNHILTMVVAALLVLTLFSVVGARSRRHMVPRGMHNFFESILSFLRTGLIRPALGVHADRFTPFIWNVFFFILFCNVLGLVPVNEVLTVITRRPWHIWGTATANLSITGGLAVMAFFTIHISGIVQQVRIKMYPSLDPHHGGHGHGHEPAANSANGAGDGHHGDPKAIQAISAAAEHPHAAAGALAARGQPLPVAIVSGIGAYIWNFAPHPDIGWKPLDLLVYVALLVLEGMGSLVKPVSLCVRLFANMMAGHLVLAALIAMIPFTAHWLAMGSISLVVILGCTALNLLELFVAFLQAYIFTFLTTLFIASAVAPEH